MKVSVPFEAPKWDFNSDGSIGTRGRAPTGVARLFVILCHWPVGYWGQRAAGPAHAVPADDSTVSLAGVINCSVA